MVSEYEPFTRHVENVAYPRFSYRQKHSRGMEFGREASLSSWAWSASHCDSRLDALGLG